jgi:hypothetical protein
MNVIFLIRQLIERCREQKKDMHMMLGSTIRGHS